MSNVPPGYKQTDVGVIPEEWKATDISKLCTLQRGFDITEATKTTGNIPVYSSSGLSYFHNKALVSPPGVVTGRKGILGKVFLVMEPFWPHDTTLWVKDFKGNEPAFVALVLENFHLERLDAATSVPTLNRNNLVGYPIPLPPLPEQRAIAAALSDVDALITSLDKLIAKKRDIKQGAMQQLLTGQKRLPGFSGEWGEKKIAELGIVGRGRVISHREIDKSISPTYPVYSSQTYNNGVMGYLDSFDFDGEYITWTTDGVNAGKVFYRTGRFNCTNVCGTIKVNNDDAYFVALALDVRARSYVSTNLANPKLMNGVVKQIPIRIPPSKAEQTAIADILSDMDTEIAALEQKRDKTKLLKQGMMQALLTGRIRLV